MQEIYQDISVDFIQQKYQKVNAKAGDLGTRFLRISCYKDGVFVPLSPNTAEAYLRYKKSDDTGVFTKGTITNEGKVEIEMVQQMLTSPGIAYADLLIIDPDGAVIDDNGHIMIETTSILSSMVFCVNVQQEALTDEDILSTNDFSAISEMIELAYANAEIIAGYVESAEGYAEAAEASATSASTSATNAASSASSASSSATSAQSSASSASTSATNAASSASDARSYMGHTETFAESAQASAVNAQGYSQDAEAYAIGKRGGTDVTSDDPTYHNNAKYYADQALQDEHSAGQAADAASSAATSAQNSKLDSEAYANGTRNGQAVPSSDPAYHNNSKYWKDQAQAIVGGQDNVKYTAQSKTSAEKAQARANIGAAKLGIVDTDASWTADTDIRTLPEGTYVITGNNSQFDYTSIMPSDWRTYQNYPNGATFLTVTKALNPLNHNWYTLTQQYYFNQAGHETVDYKMWVASEAPSMSFTPDDWCLVSMGGGSENAVEYTAQSKSEAEKAQARANIGADSVSIDKTDADWNVTSQSDFSDIDDGTYLITWNSNFDYASRFPDIMSNYSTVLVKQENDGDIWLTLYTTDDLNLNETTEIYVACTDGDLFSSGWTKVNSADVPIATTSTAGKVKPDGVSIKVDANGKIEDYGNTFIEGTDYTGVTNIHEFSNGWHKIGSNSSHLNYSQLPLTSTEIGQQEACYLHIVGGYAYGSPSASSGFWYYSAEFVATTDSQTMRKWILPLWYRDGSRSTPSASDWIRVDNVMHKNTSATQNSVAVFDNYGQVAGSSLTTSNVLTTSNSRKVVISSTAPSDTTALWVK